MAIMGFIFMPMLMKRQLHVAEADTPMDNFMQIAEGWHAAEAQNTAV